MEWLNVQAHFLYYFTISSSFEPSSLILLIIVLMRSPTWSGQGRHKVPLTYVITSKSTTNWHVVDYLQYTHNDYITCACSSGCLFVVNLTLSRTFSRPFSSTRMFLVRLTSWRRCRDNRWAYWNILFAIGRPRAGPTAAYTGTSGYTWSWCYTETLRPFYRGVRCSWKNKGSLVF